MSDVRSSAAFPTLPHASGGCRPGKPSEYQIEGCPSSSRPGATASSTQPASSRSLTSVVLSVCTTSSMVLKSMAHVLGMGAPESSGVR